jgi:hypothetical protein
MRIYKKWGYRINTNELNAWYVYLVGTFYISILKVIIILWVGSYVFLVICKVMGGDASFTNHI